MRIKHRKAHLTALLAALTLSSATAASTTLTIGGQPVTLNTTTIGGKTYVLLDDLKRALAGSGGANAKSAVDGCLGEWLFNGIWRLRVTKVTVISDPVKEQTGWAFDAELSNGTKTTLALRQAGMELLRHTVAAVTKDGKQLNYAHELEYANLLDRSILQGSGVKFTYRIFSQDKLSVADATANPPAKFLLEVKNTSPSGLRFSVPDPTFRVNLTCKK